MWWTARSRIRTARAALRSGWLAGAVVGLLLPLALDARGQGSGPASTPAGADSTAGAPLVFHGDTLTLFRAELGGIPPARRAEIALDRLRALTFSQLRRPVRIEPFAGAHALLVGDLFLFGLLDGDVDASRGETGAQAAEAARERLASALSTRARLLSPAHRGFALLWSVVATLALAVLLKFLGWARKRGLAWFATRTETHRSKLRLGNLDFLDYLSRALFWIARALTQLGALVLVTFWVVFVLGRFPETQPIADAARSSLVGIWHAVQQQVVRAIPGLIAIVLIVVTGRFLTRLTTDLFTAIERGTVRVPAVHPETAHATRRLIVVLIWAMAVVVAYPLVPGSGSDAFKGVSVFLGLMVTLGSSGIVGHMMSGLVLVYSRALRKGDIVRVNEIEGIVTEVGPLSVKLANPRKEEFTIPNSVIVGTTVKNYTRLDRESGGTLSTTVTIGYDAPWRVVYEMLEAAAAQTAGIRKEPEPVVYQLSLSDFFVEYQLVVRVEDGVNRLTVLTQLHQNIQDAFNERGVQIMSPHFEGQPDRAVVVPRSRWNRAPGDAQG